MTPTDSTRLIDEEDGRDSDSPKKPALDEPGKAQSDWAEKIDKAVSARNATRKAREGKSPALADTNLVPRWTSKQK